jgi:hypothetical protein
VIARFILAVSLIIEQQERRGEARGLSVELFAKDFPEALEHVHRKLSAH